MIVSSGTLSIQSSPAPLCTLYDGAGRAVPGFASLPATGYDAGALASPRLWLLLDAGSLAAGFYTLVFAFQALGSDGLTRAYQVCVEVEVEEPA